jgi:hypothetical protein
MHTWKKFSQAAHCLSGAVFGQENGANLVLFQLVYPDFQAYWK